MMYTESIINMDIEIKTKEKKMFKSSVLLEKIETLQQQIGELQAENKELSKAKETLERDYEMREKQAIAMMEIEKKEAILEEKDKLQTEFNKKLDCELQKNFDKLSKSLTTIHEDGNATTKYIQELSMKMIDRVAPGVQQISYTEKKSDD